MDGMDSVAWMSICRRVVARQRGLFSAQETIEGRTRYEGRGEGGDMTLELDRRCEDIVFEELEAGLATGPSVLAISEERGEVAIGGGEASIKVVIDPIDGSMNVRRMIPSHSLSIAVGEGDSMADVSFGFVHDFGADHEFAATRGEGATVNGLPIEPDPPDHGLEVVGLESAEPSWVGPSIAALEGKVYRLRVVGSIAITMSWVAAARIDGMFSARPCRSVDAAASQLIVAEAGGAVDFGGIGAEQASLDLDARYTVAAVRRQEHLGTILEAQAAGPATSRQTR
jgi:myo-inositol-1(or 4)-monophosphatase